MKTETKKILFVAAGSAIVGGVAFFIVRKITNNNKFAELMLTIHEGEAEQVGDISGLKALDPTYYNEPMGGKAIVLYKAAKLQELSDALYEAFKGIGTRDKKIYAIYTGIENQKKMSQVANAYAVKYGETLISRLIKELDEKERSSLYKIVKSKPEYQISKT
jgi:hypothetical protein